ncbi:MAG: choice-of-anchor L domain-containing protein [Saprospirales bacterium]|nr:choice-of-anchor L domain-containing protein [Saprospirales bacterium]
MMGYFEAANTDLGVDAGIVICSGDVNLIGQPVAEFANQNNQTPGDADLQALAGFQSYDAAVLEFDITVSDEGDLEFQYVFGSEEYPEFVGSSFNDVFAFLSTIMAPWKILPLFQAPQRQ